MKKKPINIFKLLNKGIVFLDELQSATITIQSVIQIVSELQKQQQQIKPVNIKEKIDPYVVLGVFHDDSEEAIKAVYRARVKFYHTDKPGGDKEKFISIDKAYKAILKEKKETKGE